MPRDKKSDKGMLMGCDSCLKENEIRHIQNSILGHLTDLGEIAREIVSLKARVASLELNAYKEEESNNES